MESDEYFTIPIDGFEHYSITNNGKIINTKNNKKISASLNNGYKQSSLTSSVDHKNKKFAVHRLVALVLLPKICGKNVVNHKDGNKLNNHVDNLEWTTQSENVAHSLNVLHGRTSHPRMVIQLKDGKQISEHKSVTEAGKAVGLTRHAINKVCLGINKTAGGYEWEFVDKNHNHKNIDLSGSRRIYDYDNYFVFPDGQVYNRMRKSFLKPVVNASGYCYITLCRNGKKKNHYVHRIVAEHFISTDKQLNFAGLQVNHKNRERNDNRVENLEWVTSSENMIHANYKLLDTKSNEKLFDGPS
jgi:hypothetical protein